MAYEPSREESRRIELLAKLKERKAKRMDRFGMTSVQIQRIMTDLCTPRVERRPHA